MNDHFFGYGSLVNRLTHGYAPAYPATLIGWRRVWRPTGRRRLAFLSIMAAPGAEIDGLIAPVPGDDWAALDAREFAYERLPVAASSIRHPLASGTLVQVYAVPDSEVTGDPAAHPVLLSYLDVVVQGFHAEFGRDGVARFFATTDGWQAPIINDRATPLYPRAQQLANSVLALVDDHLTALGARLVDS